MKIEDYNEYYIQGSDHYLIPKDVFKELFNEMVNWKEENKQLKEIITKALNKIDNMFNEGNDDTIIDDLLELERILEGSDSNE